MKKVFLLFIIVLISNSLLGQTQKNPDPNTTVVTLIILNDNGEVLIKRATIGWITIGAFYEQRETLNEVIASLSNKYGVSISKPELKGVFTYKFGFNNSLSVRQFYVAKSTTNDLPKNKNVEFHWAPKDEAIEKFSATVPSLGEMVEQILDYPQVVWGGSFLINRENEKRTSEQTEDFYPISDPSAYRTSSPYSLIEKTLQNYMEGSSYNKLDMLESAFAENATLYLTGRDGDFKVYTPKEYCGFFKNAEKGKFNGRDAKVLAIEVVKDIATAKVEIAGPEREWVYIDLFLLKKFDDEWKIISKTATRIDDNNEKEKTPEVNSPVVRLTIINDKNEILIRKTKYGWMTPAHRFYSKQNMHQVLDSMAANHGITIKNVELAGIFTYKYTFKEKADTRQFYIAKYESGIIKSSKDEEVFWLPKDEAIQKLDATVSSLGLMTNQIVAYPNTLWGGSFILDKVDGKLQSKVEEPFYSLRNNQ